LFFAIPDKTTTKEKVTQLVHKFGIQVDNLTQFLPQERVREFAAMKPFELLRETQRATLGTAHLQLHDDLIAMQSSGGKEKFEYDRLLGEQAVLTEECDSLEVEVKRLAQKRELQKFVSPNKEFYLIYLFIFLRGGKDLYYVGNSYLMCVCVCV
jgi:hypothetical protein